MTEPTTAEIRQEVEDAAFEYLPYSKVILLLDRLEAAAQSIEELDRMLDISVKETLKAEATIKQVRELHSFPVRHAPSGEKAVWLSDIQALIKGE